jgi:hypothetical protein
VASVFDPEFSHFRLSTGDGSKNAAHQRQGRALRHGRE